tara:strand:+ start:155 stop:406 length:252 start_codon:yes stop_codon:yes gene_type:complete
MAIDQDLVAKGFKRLLILLVLLIASPLLLTISFKAIKLYTEGISLYISVFGVVFSAILIFFTLFFGYKTFKILLDALFSDKSS